MSLQKLTVCVFCTVEKGEFLALDLGGSKFKVLQVRVCEDGRGGKVEMDSETYPVPAELRSGRGSEVRPRGLSGVTS